jgi:hypothetical protein
MAGRLYRCFRCNPPWGRNFIGAQPVCPQCNATPPAVQVRALIHWLRPDPNGPILGGPYGSRYQIACTPGRLQVRGDANHQADIVTCPECQKAEDWQRAFALHVEENNIDLGQHDAVTGG